MKTLQEIIEILEDFNPKYTMKYNNEEDENWNQAIRDLKLKAEQEERDDRMYKDLLLLLDRLETTVLSMKNWLQYRKPINKKGIYEKEAARMEFLLLNNRR
jgi:small-conductance mechanosensitive channel